MFVSMQGSLFGIAGVAFDERFATLQRMQLDADAWIDYASMWLHGDVEIFDAIAQGAPWEQPVVRMYDREVVTPRLVAQVDPSLHPVIPDLIDVLSDRYGVRLDRVSAGWYRNGDDSVAFHGDRIARDLTEAIVATVSLGEPRRFLIRPKAAGESHTLSLGHGDLVVMGGSCQRTWEHAVPKVRRADPRIALMFRHSYGPPHAA
ncbi:MAG: alpha-ketoglutarate-dependent dioxygenase AlkB [Acidimicrobiia bacterium]